MKKFGLQLWSIRDEFKTEENIKMAFRKMHEFGYSEAQTAGTYDFIAPETFRKCADEAEIEIIGTHYEWARIRDDFESTVKYHKALGAKNIGIGGYCRPVYGELKEFIKQFNEVSEKYAEEGFTLSYHNHSGEFSNLYKRYEGKTFFDYLIEELNPETTSFCLDTAWAQLAGMDVRALIERLNGRISILHIKDVQALATLNEAGDNYTYRPERVEVGRGNMNFKGIIETAEKCGVKHFIVEDEIYSTGCPLESVKMSADYIKANLLEK